MPHFCKEMPLPPAYNLDKNGSKRFLTIAKAACCSFNI